MPNNGFEIYESINGGGFVEADSASPGQTYAVIGGLPAGASVTFQVVALGFGPNDDSNNDDDGTDSAPSAPTSAITTPNDDSQDWQTVADGLSVGTDGNIVWAGQNQPAGTYRVALQSGGDHDPTYGWETWDYRATDGALGTGGSLANIGQPPIQNLCDSESALDAYGQANPATFVLPLSGPLGFYHAVGYDPQSDSQATTWNLQYNTVTDVSISSTYTSPGKYDITITRDGPADAPDLTVSLVISGTVNPSDYSCADEATISKGDSSTTIQFTQNPGTVANGTVTISVEATDDIQAAGATTTLDLYNSTPSTTDLSVSGLSDSDKDDPGLFIGVDDGYSAGYKDAAGNPVANNVGDYNTGFSTFDPNDPNIVNMSYTIGNAADGQPCTVSIYHPGNYMVWWQNGSDYVPVASTEWLMPPPPGAIGEETFSSLPLGNYSGTLNFKLEALAPTSSDTEYYGYPEPTTDTIGAGLFTLGSDGFSNAGWDSFDVTAVKLQLSWADAAANSPTSTNGQDITFHCRPRAWRLVPLTASSSLPWSQYPAGTTFTLSYSHGDTSDVRVWSSDDPSTATELLGDGTTNVPITAPSDGSDIVLWVQGDGISAVPRDITFTLTATLLGESAGNFNERETGTPDATTAPSSKPTTMATTNQGTVLGRSRIILSVGDTNDVITQYIPGYTVGSDPQPVLSSGTTSLSQQFAPQRLTLSVTNVDRQYYNEAIIWKIDSVTDFSGYCGNECPSALAAGKGDDQDFSFDPGKNLRTLKFAATAKDPLTVSLWCKDYAGVATVTVFGIRSGVTTVIAKLTIPLDENGDAIADAWEFEQEREWDQVYNIGPFGIYYMDPSKLPLADWSTSDPTLDNPKGPGLTDFPAEKTAGNGMTVWQEYRGYVFDGGGFDSDDNGGLSSATFVRLSPAIKTTIIDVQNMAVQDNNYLAPPDATMERGWMDAVAKAVSPFDGSGGIGGLGIRLYYVLDAPTPVVAAANLLGWSKAYEYASSQAREVTRWLHLQFLPNWVRGDKEPENAGFSRGRQSVIPLDRYLWVGGYLNQPAVIAGVLHELTHLWTKDVGQDADGHYADGNANGINGDLQDQSLVLWDYNYFKNHKMTVELRAPATYDGADNIITPQLQVAGDLTRFANSGECEIGSGDHQFKLLYGSINRATRILGDLSWEFPTPNPPAITFLPNAVLTYLNPGPRILDSATQFGRAVQTNIDLQ